MLLALLVVFASFAPVLPQPLTHPTFVSPCGSTIHGNVQQFSTLSHAIYSFSSEACASRRVLVKTGQEPPRNIRYLPKLLPLTVKAGQLKSGTGLRRATEADLKTDSLQDTQHLLRKMAKTFFSGSLRAQRRRNPQRMQNYPLFWH